MNVKGDAVNNWEFFRQQWTDYEVATSLDKQEQKIRLATFRSVMGKECLQIFLNLKLSPEERDDISECIKALESYFKPKRNVVYERYQFNMCTQNLDEPVDSFINQLQKAASTCEFGMLTDELIRDRLVIGLQDHSTKLRLLKEETLDLNKALNICRSSEAASHQLKAMKIDEKKPQRRSVLFENAIHVITRNVIPRNVKIKRQCEKSGSALIVEENRDTTSKIVRLTAMNAKHARSPTTSRQYADQLLDDKLNK